MRQDLLNYIIGMCQAAAAALMVSAVVVPEHAGNALACCVLAIIAGAVLVVHKHRGGK